MGLKNMEENSMDLEWFDDGLCAYQRICAEAFVWDDEWLVFADQFGPFKRLPRHFAVQFRRRPQRARYSMGEK